MPNGRYYIKAQLLDAKDWLDSDRFYVINEAAPKQTEEIPVVAPAAPAQNAKPFEVVAGVGI